MEPSHPSLALLAYTAAVEAVSKSSWATKIDPDNRSGPSDRFKSTIHLIAEDMGVVEIVKQARWYSLRSETVHDGAMHGYEQGIGPLVAFDIDIGEQPQSSFALRTVPQLRSLTCRLIELSLQGLDPRAM